MFAQKTGEGLAHRLKSYICCVRATVRHIHNPELLVCVVGIEAHFQGTTLNRGRGDCGVPIGRSNRQLIGRSTIRLSFDGSSVDSQSAVQKRSGRELQLEPLSENDPKISLSYTHTSNSATVQPPHTKEGSPMLLKTKTLINTRRTWTR